MKRFSVLFIVTTLCILSIPPLLEHVQSQSRTLSAQTPTTKFFKSVRAVPQQYLVLLKEDIPRSEVAAIASNLTILYGGTVEYIYLDVFKGFSVQNMSEKSALALSARPEVKRVEENARVTVTGQEAHPSESGTIKPLDRIDQRSGLDGSYHWVRAGTGVHVYVVDTGIWMRNDGFQGRVAPLWDFDPATSVGGYATGSDNHGTMVASLIGSAGVTGPANATSFKSFGVAKNSQMYSVRVTNLAGAGTVSHFTAGLQKIIDDVTTYNKRPAVVNFSLGFFLVQLPEEPPPISSNQVTAVEQAVNSLVNNGITVVCGAGNDNVNASNFTPARMTTPGVITVGATTGIPGPTLDNKWQWSNFGASVDLYAPAGEAPYFTRGLGWGVDSGHDGARGTSMAAPLVTGAVALYLEQYALDPFNSQAQPAQVEAQIKQNASAGASGLPILYVGTDFITPPASEPSNETRFFVRQQYYDFLSRHPDQEGWDHWTDNINLCNDPARRPANQTVGQCIDRQRETTSAAFFISPEFQYTGYYVYRFYQGSLGRKPTFSEFFADKQIVANGILVGEELSGTVIEQNKAAFANQFVQRQEFNAIYGSLNDQQYVDKLFETTTIAASVADRADLVNKLNSSQLTRAQVLQKVVDGILVIAEGQQQFQTTYGKAFYEQEYNRAFVLMEYFGYLRRDPDAPGYAHWLDKLNFYGNYIDAEMVRSFIISPEYLYRFGLSNAFITPQQSSNIISVEKVAWNNAVGVSVAGSSLTGTMGGWNTSGAVSTQSIPAGDGYAEFTANESSTYRMFGLSRGNSDQNYTDIDFAFYPAAGGQLYIYEAGINRGAVSSYAPGDSLRVSVEGGVVKYRKISQGVNSLLYTSTVAPTYPLLVDTSLYSNGATITNAVIAGTLDFGVAAGPVPFYTGFESGQRQPDWYDSADYITSVSGYCCGLTSSQSSPRQEAARLGTTALMYSGTDTSAAGPSYSYNKVFDVHIPVTSTTELSYWIYPQAVSGNNSAYVSIDLFCTDGSSVRDSGAVDQWGVRVHPAFQGAGGKLSPNQWNLVRSKIGTWLAGKTIYRIYMAYDQPQNTGPYRGYIDDISIINAGQ